MSIQTSRDFNLIVGMDTSLSFKEFEKDIAILVSELNKNPPKIKVSIDIDGSKSGIQSQIANINSSIKSTGQSSNIKTLTLQSREYYTALKQVDTLLNQVNTNQQKWTAAKNGMSKKSYNELSGYARELELLIKDLGTGTLKQTEFNQKLSEIRSGVVRANGAIKQAGEATQTWGERIGGLAAKFGTWFNITHVITAAYRAFKRMLTAVIELDTAMTELRKVTDETETTYDNFLDNAAKRAKQLGATLADTVTSTSDFARLGYGIDDAEKLADVAIIYKNVGDGIQDINDASESIIATMQAFGIEAKDAMSIVDKFNIVGNNYAISSKGVGDALLRSAAAMHAANNTLDETIALATAANTIVQDPEKVGTTLKTVSMYLRAAKTDAEEAGISVDGMASSTSELREEILSLTGQKVDIQIDEDTFKSTYQILYELSQVWNSLTDVSKANLLEQIGGKRNANVVAALLENFTVAEKSLETSSHSAGSALKENEKVLDSIEGKISIFTASFEEFANTLINGDSVKFVVDLGTSLMGILTTLAQIIEKLGGLGTILEVLVPIGLSVGLPKIIAKLTGAFQTMTGAAVNFLYSWVHNASKCGSVFQGLIGTIGKFNAAIIGITVLVAIIDAIVVTVDEANKKLEEAKNNYQSITNEVNTLNEELEATKNRITELQNKGKLSFTEQEELERLKKTNIELERSINLAKTKQQIEKSNQYNALKESIDTFKYSPTRFGKAVNGSYLISEQAKLHQLYEDYNWNMDWYNKTGDTGYLDWAQKNQQDIDEIISKVIDATDGLEYIENPLTPEDKEINAALDFYNDVIDKYSIINNLSGAKESALHRLTNYTFNNETEKLRELGAEGRVTADTLSEDKYDAFINKAIALGIVSDDSAASLELLASYFNSLCDASEDSADSIEGLTDKTKSYISTANSVKGVSDALSMLDEIYADIYDKGDFDWGSIINNQKFKETFGELGNYYTDFIQTVANSPSDISACQSAFDNLVREYINSSNVLNKVTEDTRDMAVAMLEQAGVSNAVAIVDAYVAKNKEILRIQTELGTEAKLDEILALYTEGEASRFTAQAIYELALAKIQTNDNSLLTSNDIAQLEKLAEAAGATVESLLNVAKAKAYISNAEALEKQKADLIASGADPRGISTVSTQAYNYRLWAEELLNQKPTYDVDFDYAGGSATRNAISKASKKQETWFEKQLAKHQHLVAMEQETEAEYLDWLSKAYPQAYNEGIISLNDFYKYQEEVFTGLRDLFKDYLSDIEHEISMRENYDGESKKIISLYEKLIADVEKEIAKARAQGLTEEDDYLQELLTKWQDYKTAVKDIKEETVENAKDAVDELVEYRIDMLKQEIEDEKDALDKKLDYLKEFYDKQKEMLQDKYDEEKYLEEQAEKRKSVSDIQAELAMLESDDSAWAQKRKLELQEELNDAQKDLTDFEDEHALDMALDALDASYEAQEQQIKAEMDALDERLNDPEALFNQALSDIKNNTGNLYQMMLEYNRKHGTGNDEDVTDIYENAYKVLLEYKNLYGEDYKGVKLPNSTGYKSENGSYDDTPVAKPQTPPASTPSSSGSSSAPSLTKGSYVEVKPNTRWYENSAGGGRSGKAKSGKIKYINTKGSHPYNIDGLGWVRKTDIVGYASGTRNARPGLARIFEEGYEQIFTSSDGNKYKLFNAGDKVLNAKATEFLYDFANSGGEIFNKILAHVLSGNMPKLFNNGSDSMDIHMGDIIIQGNADNRTVSEIRRAQRENIDYILKEFTKLKN